VAIDDRDQDTASKSFTLARIDIGYASVIVEARVIEYVLRELTVSNTTVPREASLPVRCGLMRSF
jgi:hypothetical protein